MIGAIAGDIIGSRFERHNTRRYDFRLFTEHSTFTDDTVLTVAVMDALSGHGDISDALRAWCNRYRHAGFGPRFLLWVGGESIVNSKGNGAAMRVSPIGWMGSDLGEVMEMADNQAWLTHNSPEAREAARAVAGAVFLARSGVGKDAMRRELGWYRGIGSWPPKVRKPGAIATESVPAALAAFMASTGFEDCIRKAVSIGGDSDTIASIAGAVAGAHYGVPEPIASEVRKRLPDVMLETIDGFAHFIASREVHHVG